ncbi:MAG: hypothetical protein LBF41_06020, partial [Deltaproteobacteria bacterium]|nr:hypothetical protein [Deltaproteobacteria bacterium]
MKTNLTFFGLTTLLLAICLFSAAMPAQAQDVYQRQMDKAFRDNNIPLMKQMLAKGAEIPDISTSSAADKPLAVLKFMMDNGYEPDPK